MKMRIIQFGLGPIGCKLTRFLSERSNIEIVGAVDCDPEKVGKDIGELAGLGKKVGVTVSPNIGDIMKEIRADVVVLTTASSIVKVRGQIIEILEHGLNIVSTCEELSYPWLTNPEISEEIDTLARGKGVAVLATGVNPGFVMDLLPLSVTGVCRDVKQITVERFQDAQYRRIPFQKKIGAGLTVAEFNKKVEDGSLRHVGLTESMHMIASKIGWKIEKQEEDIKPITAQNTVETQNMKVEAGNVLGVEQTGHCYVNGEEKITMIFRAAIGLTDPVDRVTIKGDPEIELSIKGGIFGDTATCAIVVNAIPVVLSSSPGLKTMADIKPVSFFSGN